MIQGHLPAALRALLPLDGVCGEAALLVGLVTIGIMIGWERLRPASLRLIPGALLGVGNGLCGLLGGIPMTGVIVRSGSASARSTRAQPPSCA